MLAVIIFSACQNGKNYSRLESAAALLESDKVDSAYLVLKSIRHNQLTEKEQNFFNQEQGCSGLNSFDHICRLRGTSTCIFCTE